MVRPSGAPSSSDPTSTPWSSGTCGRWRGWPSWWAETCHVASTGNPRATGALDEVPGDFTVGPKVKVYVAAEHTAGGEALGGNLSLAVRDPVGIGLHPPREKASLM